MTTVTCIDCGVPRELTGYAQSAMCSSCAQTRDGKQRRAKTPGTWVEASLCAQVGGELWFPEPGGSPALAKRICRRCPVIGECLAWAIETDQEFGVYGGATRRERLRSTGRKAAA